MHPMLNTAIKAARRAGGIINRASRNLDIVAVREKAANDFVTEVDRESEEAIIRTLLEAYPKHGILAKDRVRYVGEEIAMVVATQGLGAEFLKKEVQQRGIRNLKVLPWQPYERLPEVLATGELMALCPLSSPEAQGEGPLPLADIESELIAMAENDPLGQMLHHAGESLGQHLDSRITVQTYQLARSLVEAGVDVVAVESAVRSAVRPHRFFALEEIPASEEADE